MNEKPGDCVKFKFGNGRCYLRDLFTRKGPGSRHVDHNDSLLVVATVRFPDEVVDDVLVLASVGMGWIHANNLVPINGPTMYE